MLRWIVMLAALCFVSAALGLGQFIPMASSMQSFFLILTAVSAMLLISTCDAFETQAVRVRDDEN
jgi:hypothetical protein